MYAVSGDYFIQSGCDLNVLHRLMAFASVTLDSRHIQQVGFLMFAYLGVTS